MKPSIPTAVEINVFNSLDERCALEHFLGKDLPAAEAVFRSNFLFYAEDLMWMGPKAFCFYVIAAMNFLRSDVSEGVWCAGPFCVAVGFQFEHYRKDVAVAAPVIRAVVRAILKDMDRFEGDPSDASLANKRYRQLLEQLDA